MQIIVLSDNHGRSSVVERIVDAHPGCDTYLHLGDSQGGMAHIQELYPNKTFYCVRGNCDGSCDYPDELELTFQGHHLLAVHGHQQGVKYSLSALLAEGRRRGADICLFGHTAVSILCSAPYIPPVLPRRARPAAAPLPQTAEIIAKKPHSLR